jgi:hypothetical protein
MHGLLDAFRAVAKAVADERTASRRHPPTPEDILALLDAFARMRVHSADAGQRPVADDSCRISASSLTALLDDFAAIRPIPQAGADNRLSRIERLLDTYRAIRK